MFKINFNDYEIKNAGIRFIILLKSYNFRSDNNIWTKKLKNYGFELNQNLDYDLIIKQDENIFEFSYNIDDEYRHDVYQSFDLYINLLIKNFLLKEKGFYVTDYNLYKSIHKGDIITINHDWKIIDIDVIKNNICFLNKKEHIKLNLSLSKSSLDFIFFNFDILDLIKIQYKGNLIHIIK